jgi:SAM-dependent methyltransferase
MNKIDYNEISRNYDDVRNADVELINHFLQETDVDANTRVLDIGCGTGNYTSLFQNLTGAQFCGIDPSSGMLEKARSKNPNITFAPGNAAEVPFPDDSFDFIYMTDVIHHVPDLAQMFREIDRVLKPGGKCCIVTQSHEQIDQRPTSKFFPGTAAADKKRYPDIPLIRQTAAANGFSQCKVDNIAGEPTELDEDYLRLVESKGYSVFHLISAEEFELGRQALKERLTKKPVFMQTAGTSLVWLSR